MTFQKILIILLIFLLLGFGGWYFYQQRKAPSSMNIEEARSIALLSQCFEKGIINPEGVYNENSKTWWFDLLVKDEFKQKECNPACVVFTETKTAEIDWRCTGLINSSKDGLIRVSVPKPNQIIRSPLSIEGEARGMWYFEASFPVEIVDMNGNILGTAVAAAQRDWMTENFVPFKAQLAFATPTVERGLLIFKKDNPSGLPENNDELKIPILFDRSETPQQRIKLYYYNSSKDRDASGNILCSKNGLDAVERNIPLTKTPIQDTIKLLLKGELTPQERAKGITTKYPLSGLALKSASLQNGILTITFVDPQNKTGGGSCRVGVLWSQIEATAKQFPEVSSVRFLPEELFQP